MGDEQEIVTKLGSNPPVEDRLGDITDDQWDLLLKNSALVSNRDIGLVSDSQLASVRFQEAIQLFSHHSKDGTAGSLSTEIRG